MSVPHRIRALMGLFALLAIFGFTVPHALAATDDSSTLHAIVTKAPTPLTFDPHVLRQKLGGCSATATPNATPNLTAPHLVTTIAITGSNGPINSGGIVQVAKYPFSLTYTITITNTGNADMFTPASIGFVAGDLAQLLLNGGAIKWTYMPLPKLAVGTSKTFVKKITYKGGGFPFVEAVADAYCQIYGDHSEAEVGTALQLESPTVDLQPIAALVQPWPTHLGDGVTAGDEVEVGFLLANYGAQKPSHDMLLKLATPIVGKAITVTVAQTDLPGPHTLATYVVGTNGNPTIYSVKKVAKPTYLPINITLNTPRAFTEDSYANNATKSKTLVVSSGVNLRGTISITASCPAFTISTISGTITVYNGGTQDISTSFQVQPLLDGKPFGAPVTVSGVAAGKNVALAPIQFTVTKQGFHTFGVLIDSTKAVPEYNEADNKVTSPKYFIVQD